MKRYQVGLYYLLFFTLKCATACISFTVGAYLLISDSYCYLLLDFGQLKVLLYEPFCSVSNLCANSAALILQAYSVTLFNK